MHKFIKYSVCFFIVLLFLSCNNDELVKNQENAKTVKTDLELAKFSNPNIAQNVEADFENVNVIEKDNFKISEFSAKEKVVNTFESDVLQSHLKYQGVTIESDGKSQSYFLEVFTLAKSAVYPETITNLKDFTGGLNVYSFNGENLGSVVVRNGKAANVSGKNELDVLTKAINLFYAPSNITSKIPLCDATYTQTVWLTQDVWRIISNGPKILEVIYVGEKVTKTINILPYPCDGPVDIEAIKLQRIAHYANYDQNGQYLGESSTFNFSTQITNNLTGKAKCINDLLNQKGNSFVEKLLSNFEGTAKFNIVIGSADKVFNKSNEEINGSTTYNGGSNDLQILISTSRVEGISSLETARLILHEYIHADMLRKLFSTDINDIEAANFREVYSRYAGEQYHSAMANQYMSGMKGALKDFHKYVLREDFDKFVNYYGKEPSDELYEAMAWNGLKEVDVVAWNNLTPEKKASIDAMYNNVAKKLTQVRLCDNK